MSAASSALLEIDNVYASYGGIKALKGVSFSVREGEIACVLGANGAGKSTLLKCIMCAEKITAGRISFCGMPLTRRPHPAVRGIALVPEGRQVFTHLTVYDNLLAGAYCRRDKAGIKNDIEKVFALFPRLKERINQYGGHLSGGEQQMLALSRAIMSRPRLLLLDEPSLGLAPIIVDQIFDIIREINAEGTAVLLVEQNARKALSICVHAVVLASGIVEAQGTGSSLLADDTLLSAYLGG
ncbi:MAG: ABC transporter ATP-binding protein [Spirochaetaceae bacterium]|jgi:branched-chain amino acid transport system ATP-binding protein|nr:ABC transporter ATP-binding protein [Spirochaetaceae bacterium]